MASVESGPDFVVGPRTDVSDMEAIYSIREGGWFYSLSVRIFIETLYVSC